jgi:hypothetical protein
MKEKKFLANMRPNVTVDTETNVLTEESRFDSEDGKIIFNSAQIVLCLMNSRAFLPRHKATGAWN